MKYINSFIKLKCAPDILALKIFPNVKEICEAMGIFRIIKDYISQGDSKVLVLVIGDGKYPRLGTLIAFRSRWTAISIDPRLVVDSCRDVKRLFKIDRRIQESHAILKPMLKNIKMEVNFDKIIVTLPHAHISITDVVDSLKDLNLGDYMIVSMPCCVPEFKEPTLVLKHVIDIRDNNIPSPKNKISVYKVGEK